MTHDEVQDLLEAYVDERLDRGRRREVDAHLRDCAECRAILDEVAPVDLAALGATGFDEGTMRRTVRASLFRTAFNAVLILVALWIAIWFFSILVVQPLVVNRGGRAADAVRMSIDLPIMTTPGALLADGRIDSGLISRDVDLSFAIPVGAGFRPAVSTSSRIGIFGVSSSPVEESLTPVFYQGDPTEQLANLGAGTVATVSIYYGQSLAIADAEAIANAPGDVRVVWTGFDASLGRTAPLEPPFWTYAGTLGYGTCLGTSPGFDDETLGATSAGFGSASTFAPVSVQGALDSVIAGLENIAGRPELADYVVEPYGGDPDEFRAIIDDLHEDPRVTMLVVTGPSPSVAEFVAAAPEGSSASVLAVDFYNWTPGICGGSE